MAELTADHIVRYLDRCGYVVMKSGPPSVLTAIQVLGLPSARGAEG
jgi:hypothetical protein